MTRRFPFATCADIVEITERNGRAVVVGSECDSIRAQIREMFAEKEKDDQPLKHNRLWLSPFKA